MNVKFTEEEMILVASLLANIKMSLKKSSEAGVVLNSHSETVNNQLTILDSVTLKMGRAWEGRENGGITH